MRFLKHRLRDVPAMNKWSTMRKPKNVFYKNADFDFLRAMNSRFNLNVCAAIDIFDGKHSTFYFSNSPEDRYNIVFCMGIESNPETVELTLLKDYTLPDEVFEEGNSHVIEDYINVYTDHRNSVIRVNDTKRNYLSSLERLEEDVAKLKGFGRRQRLLKSLNIVNYLKTFEFNDVVAEDTCCDGDDIELGTLKFQVNFRDNKVNLIEGSYPRNTAWGNTFHPHDLGADGICLGSQSADMAEAIKNLETDIIQVMLYKFAHSYTSRDSAGANWKKWTEEGDNMVYSDYHDEEIYLSEAVQMDNGDWILEETSVTLTDGRIYPSGWATWSEYYDGYIDEDLAVWSNHLESYIDGEADTTVELFNGDYSDRSHDEIFEYEDNYYLVDEVVEDINGDTVPKHLTVYSQVLSEFILEGEAIMQNGEYYTEDTLPAVEETTTAVEETTDERSPW